MATPPRKAKFRPGEAPPDEQRAVDLDEAKRVATQFDRANQNRRARDRVASDIVPEPVKVEPKTTGRGLPPAARAAVAPTEAASVVAPGDPLRPFAGFAPDAGELTGGVKQSQNESLQVMAIVLSLLFMISAAAVVTVIVGAVGLYTVQVGLEDGLAGLTGGSDDEDHLRDTGVVPTDIIKKKPVPRKGGSPKEPVEVAPVPKAPTVGDGTIIVPTDILFRSIEVNCPQSGIRTRANFVAGRATAHGLPLDEDCVVTFQGSQPAKAKLRGGQTKTCTFEPTNCR